MPFGWTWSGGLAIIAVIYGHVENVAKIEAVFEREDWMVTTNMTLVLLRMPMLMFLSGMLVPRSIAKGWEDVPAREVHQTGLAVCGVDSNFLYRCVDTRRC